MANCETCEDTGFYGDNGPGIKGNKEYQPCDQCDYHPVAQDEPLLEEEEEAFEEWAKKKRYGWTDHGKYLWMQGYLAGKEKR